MIKVEKLEGFNDLIKTYSDRKMMILQDQTGIMYAEAIDIDSANYTYTETEIPIEQNDSSEPLNEQISDEEAIDIIFGGEY